jgi:hypothetical protein
MPVTSGVIQGSVLGPTLFNVFINEIYKFVKHSLVLKYADDMRIFLSSPKNTIDANGMQNRIQDDINNLVLWATSSGMTFNTNKCFSASFGRSKSTRIYEINGNAIDSKSSFIDLGIKVNTPLNFKSHINTAVSKAFGRLGIVNKIFKYKDPRTTTGLFKAFVRPSLEYSSTVWSPYTQTSINNMERVQRRMCRSIPGIRHLSYQDQLKTLGLLSLQARRLRYQLITMYKLHKGLLDIDFNDFFNFRTSGRTRGHKYHLVAKFSSNNYRSNFFTISSISLWNKLSQKDIEAPSVAAFKGRLASFFTKMGIW